MAENVSAAILAAHQRLMVSFTLGDAAGVATVYAADGQLLPVYSNAISGQAAIQAFWQGCFDMGIGSFERKPSEVEFFGTTANEVGSYVLYGRNHKVIDIGKYIVIWKLQHREWKIYRDIWTSNLPA